ncbi:hypothetical protein QBC40DRAFT_280461 [Triangularia verruculosa]|uniref:T6SS Phospholipase effector Tle1-like catalytic domain-containing protein n=1 Tax=Triangularia verruculosa TaxID=2587418 RepID=A0AAN6XHC9_9PEZI|nr:hypothetical protein QBC40DRAFT_280461 [Triangularia verruculosa]
MQPTAIEFLGVFDTVVSLGFPDVAGFRFTCAMPTNLLKRFIPRRPSIKRTFQAAALTEHREKFKCVLYKRKHQAQVPSQVWFPGSHESVGGGNGDPHLGGRQISDSFRD